MTGATWRGLLDQAWAAVAGDVVAPAEVRLDGPGGGSDGQVPPLASPLPSTLPVADAALACVGSALLAAAALGGGRTRSVSMDAEHVAAAVRSEGYLRVAGRPFGSGFAPLSRFWPTADGWVRTHANYPWHRSALLSALGLDPTRDDDEAAAAAVTGSLADLPAEEVERRIVAAGGVAAALRTPDEWLAHPHGRVVATEPLIGETWFDTGPAATSGPASSSSASSSPASSSPAAGIRVLDLTRVIAGPVATRYLAALGADVLRLDPPARPELPLHQLDGMPGKRSALLDAATTEGLVTLHELLDGADVLVHGYRPGALARFGLAPETLAERHPGLVVVALSAWGSQGPWGGRRGFDSIVQVATGIAVRESPEGPAAGHGARPGALPCQLLDHGTGYLCAAAALDGLRRRAERGGTWVRELSLAGTAHWLLSQPATERGPVTGFTPVAGAGWLDELPSAGGPVTTVAPPGALDGVPPRWPARPLGYGTERPRWSPRTTPGPTGSGRR